MRKKKHSFLVKDGKGGLQGHRRTAGPSEAFTPIFDVPKASTSSPQAARLTASNLVLDDENGFDSLTTTTGGVVVTSSTSGMAAQDQRRSSPIESTGGSSNGGFRVLGSTSMAFVRRGFCERFRAAAGNSARPMCKGIRVCGNRKVNLVLHTFWGLVYFTAGAAQIVAGIYFMLQLPVFNLGSNIWTGAWNVFAGIASLVLTCHRGGHGGDDLGSRRKSRGLLLLSLSVLVLNLVNLLILEVGEWRAFLSKEDKEFIESYKLDGLMYNAYLFTTVSTVSAMIIAFFAGQQTFCFMQLHNDTKARSGIKAQLNSKSNSPNNNNTLMRLGNNNDKSATNNNNSNANFDRLDDRDEINTKDLVKRNHGDDLVDGDLNLKSSSGPQPHPTWVYRNNYAPFNPNPGGRVKRSLSFLSGKQSSQITTHRYDVLANGKPNGRGERQGGPGEYFIPHSSGGTTMAASPPAPVHTAVGGKSHQMRHAVIRRHQSMYIHPRATTEIQPVNGMGISATGRPATLKRPQTFQPHEKPTVNLQRSKTTIGSSSAMHYRSTPVLNTQRNGLPGAGGSVIGRNSATLPKFMTGVGGSSRNVSQGSSSNNNNQGRNVHTSPRRRHTNIEEMCEFQTGKSFDLPVDPEKYRRTSRQQTRHYHNLNPYHHQLSPARRPTAGGGNNNNGSATFTWNGGSGLNGNGNGNNVTFKNESSIYLETDDSGEDAAKAGKEILASTPFRSPGDKLSKDADLYSADSCNEGVRYQSVAGLTARNRMGNAVSADDLMFTDDMTEDPDDYLAYQTRLQPHRTHYGSTESINSIGDTTKAAASSNHIYGKSSSVERGSDQHHNSRHPPQRVVNQSQIATQTTNSLLMMSKSSQQSNNNCLSESEHEAGNYSESGNESGSVRGGGQRRKRLYDTPSNKRPLQKSNSRVAAMGKLRLHVESFRQAAAAAAAEQAAEAQSKSNTSGTQTDLTVARTKQERLRSSTASPLSSTSTTPQTHAPPPNKPVRRTKISSTSTSGGGSTTGGRTNQDSRLSDRSNSPDANSSTSGYSSPSAGLHSKDNSPYGSKIVPEEEKNGEGSGDGGSGEVDVGGSRVTVIQIVPATISGSPGSSSTSSNLSAYRNNNGKSNNRGYSNNMRADGETSVDDEDDFEEIETPDHHVNEIAEADSLENEEEAEEEEEDDDLSMPVAASSASSMAELQRRFEEYHQRRMRETSTMSPTRKNVATNGSLNMNQQPSAQQQQLKKNENSPKRRLPDRDQIMQQHSSSQQQQRRLPEPPLGQRRYQPNPRGLNRNQQQQQNQDHERIYRSKTQQQQNSNAIPASQSLYQQRQNTTIIPPTKGRVPLPPVPELDRSDQERDSLSPEIPEEDEEEEFEEEHEVPKRFQNPPRPQPRNVIGGGGGRHNLGLIEEEIGDNNNDPDQIDQQHLLNLLKMMKKPEDGQHQGGEGGGLRGDEERQLQPPKEDTLQYLSNLEAMAKRLKDQLLKEEKSPRVHQPTSTAANKQFNNLGLGSESNC